MAIEAILGSIGNGVAAGSMGASEWIIGSTPVVELLRVDDPNNRAELVGVKYSHHRPADPAKGDRPPDLYTRITMLIDGGPWEQRMWNESTELDVTFRLNEPGDYIAWQPGARHRWTPIGNATMLTVSFKRIEREEEAAEPCESG